MSPTPSNSCDHGRAPARARRRGVVGVIVRDNRLLVIRRSQVVRAPGKYCFPGGGLEAGETESKALVREMHEELNVAVEPVERIWENRTRSGVRLGWWLTAIVSTQPPLGNPREVAEIHWLGVPAILQLPDLLETNREFFSAWQEGFFRLPIDVRT